MPDLLAVSRRVDKLIGRAKEIEAVRQAIFPGDQSCQIVFIQGPGGFGKTRLLEEILQRLGTPLNDEDTPDLSQREWQDYNRVVCTQIIDLFDTRLHSRNRFLQEVRECLRWMQRNSPEFNFNLFDAAVSEHQRRVLDNVEYHLTLKAAEQAIEFFWKDYRQIVSKRRLVWAIDTAEQISTTASGWLLKAELLEASQLYFQAQSLLMEGIQKKYFQNTTLLFAGRDEEGAAFFQQISNAAKHANVPIRLINIEPFSELEVKEYLDALLDEWRESETLASPGNQESINEIIEVLKWLGPAERARIFAQYTGGQPVRLSLFADLLVETGPPQDMFQDIQDAELSQEKIELRQWKWEDQFISLLFRRPRLGAERFSTESDSKLEAELSTVSLRSEILLTLVRARLGLTAEQIHYLIDNPNTLPPKEWKKQARPERVRQIATVLRELRGLSLVKPRPRRQTVGEPEKDEQSYRIGLQDEIYRIFSEHMAPHYDPGKPINVAHERERVRLERLRQHFTHDEFMEFQKRFEVETQARQQLYRLLRAWVDDQREQLREDLKRIIEKEERALEIELYRATPANSRAARLHLSDDERQYRIELRQALRELDLEYMHYEFSLRPEWALNDAYFDLAEEFWRANDEDADILTQIEMWRILFDRHAIKFAFWDEDRQQISKTRGEEGIDTLRRAAAQEDASRWIKRLVLRRQLPEAQAFAQNLEKYIETHLTGYEKISWHHTFSRCERACWAEFLHVMGGQGQEVSEALQRLEELVGQLENLAHTTINEIAITKSDGSEERGFIGHPAHIRLERVISVFYGNIGYGYTQLGDFRKAIGYYSRSLDYVRGIGATAHKATILNNMARALSEMGRQKRPRRICLDALQLRQYLGADQPIGLSHNTLALIFNDENNPEQAWLEAAKARLFFSRVDDPRGRGLADIQLGEAFRRLAGHSEFGRASPGSQEELYREGEFALDEALGIFTEKTPDEPGKVKEPVRWIEARIEKGCLYRDRIRFLTDEKRSPRERQIAYSVALGLLREAVQESRSNGWGRLELDAQVNIAWTHFYADQLDKAEENLDQADQLIQNMFPDQICRISLDYIPRPDTVHAYIYYQLSKMHVLRGRIALERFNYWVVERTQEIEEDTKIPWYERKLHREKVHKLIEKDLKMKRNTSLDTAAHHFWLAITYSQLFSPRSTALSIAYDTLYNYLKKFNEVELQFFQKALNSHFLANSSMKAKIKSLIEDLGDLQEFMHESFGVIPLPVTE